MSRRARDARTEARLIRRRFGVPYDEMRVVWWPNHRGANIMTQKKLVGAFRPTILYLLAKGAQIKTKSGW